MNELKTCMGSWASSGFPFQISTHTTHTHVSTHTNVAPDFETNCVENSFPKTFFNSDLWPNGANLQFAFYILLRTLRRGRPNHNRGRICCVRHCRHAFFRWTLNGKRFISPIHNAAVPKQQRKLKTTTPIIITTTAAAKNGREEFKVEFSRNS